jgi:hypothetical protein
MFSELHDEKQKRSTTKARFFSGDGLRAGHDAVC